MVSVDFSEYTAFYRCPIWWQNFIIVTLKDHKGSTREKHATLDDAIAEYNGVIIDSSYSADSVSALEFETLDDFNAFKLIWTIHGE